MITLRKECGLSSVKNHIFIKTSIALVAYLRRWLATHLSTQFRQALQHPPTDTPEQNWVHAATDTARTLGVAVDVRCDPDLTLPDRLSPPSWTSPLVSTTKFPYARPTALQPARLRQEMLALVASCSTRAARLYYTDGSIGEMGTAGAAFMCGSLIVAHKLPPYTTVFQADLTALLLALRYASEAYVGDIHLFTDSLTSLHALHHDSPKDNIQLLSAIHQQLTVLYWSGTAVTCHWVPRHVGIWENERLDSLVRGHESL